MPLDVTDLAVQLVQIPSVNPNSTPDPTAHPGEAAMGTAVADILTNLGATVSIAQPLPGRPNVTGLLDFGSEETIIMEAHLDTVSVEGMTVAPYGADIRDGRLWGRGACDVKGPMAAMLAAISRVAERGGAQYNVLFAAVCDEESGFTGVRHFLDTLSCGQRNNISKAIVAEPTKLNPVIAHKGVVRWAISTAGVAAHSSTPHLGKNAIYPMVHVVARLEKYCGALQSGASHPILGPATLSVGVIQGGSAVNIVPEACLIQVDRRLIPGETPESATKDLLEILAGLDVKISHPIVQAPPMETSADSAFARALLAAAHQAGAAESYFDSGNYCTDASFYGFNEIEAIVFGPGSIEHAHTKDESIAVEELEWGASAYEHFLMGR